MATAHRLYALLLGSVQAGWASAQSLLIVPHKALGSLPMGLLVTEPVPQPQPAKAGLPFSEYKSVPFLVRKVAVTQLPSVVSLTTLRALPAPKGDRQMLAAFGDPWFSAEEAAEARSGRQPGTPVGLQSRGIQTRGIPLVRRSVPKTEAVDSAELGLLPRLPDTADEVRSIALALHADLTKDVFLGEAANENTVKTMDLAHRKIVVFATHGLVPGDLNGLTQPALALSAPKVANVDGDGLLTVDEISGPEARRRLGRAVGLQHGERRRRRRRGGVRPRPRLLLCRDARAAGLELAGRDRVGAAPDQRSVPPAGGRSRPGARRGHAPGRAALIDGLGAVDPDSKKPLFAYAHPIFWAPFTVVGDGG